MEDIGEGEGTPVPFAQAVKSVEDVMALPVFARAELTPELVGEVAPMLLAHYNEVAHHKDIPLDPNWLEYFAVQERGGLRVFTARDAGRLVGYNAFLVGNHLHYKTLLIASNDVIFIKRMERGFGKHFRAYCEEQLRGEGLHLESYHVKRAHAQWEAGLQRDGFEAVETVWVKRLDR